MTAAVIGLIGHRGGHVQFRGESYRERHALMREGARGFVGLCDYADGKGEGGRHEGLVDYEDDRLGVFDTVNLVAGQSFGGACVTVELILRFDMQEGEGICLDIHRHDISDGDGGDVVPICR